MRPVEHKGRGEMRGHRTDKFTAGELIWRKAGFISEKVKRGGNRTYEKSWGVA